MRLREILLSLCDKYGSCEDKPRYKIWHVLFIPYLKFKNLSTGQYSSIAKILGMSATEVAPVLDNWFFDRLQDSLPIETQINNVVTAMEKASGKNL